MGQLLDVVPNHMGIAGFRQRLVARCVGKRPLFALRHVSLILIGLPVKPELENTVLLPILGDQYGIVLENQEIVLHYDDGQLFPTIL